MESYRGKPRTYSKEYGRAICAAVFGTTEYASKMVCRRVKGSAVVSVEVPGPADKDLRLSSNLTLLYLSGRAKH